MPSSVKIWRRFEVKIRILLKDACSCRLFVVIFPFLEMGAWRKSKEPLKLFIVLLVNSASLIVDTIMI